VYFSPNRTPEERVARQKVAAELINKRTGDQKFCYFIRKGKIMKVALQKSFHSTE
jgi:hypothetical protein